MIDLQLLRDDPELVREAMRRKGHDETDVVDRLVKLDAERRESVTELQDAQNRSNTASREIGQLMRDGGKDLAQERIAETARLKERIKELEEAVRNIEVEQSRLMMEIPNVPHPSVPVGASPADNKVIAEHGEIRSYDFELLSHWELSDRHGLIDFDRGSKVAGAGFPFYRGKGARLQRALINFFLDLATEEGGYTELQSPLLINADSARGTGQLPDKEDLMYEILRDELYLIPTAEVPVTNFLREEILEDGLPIKFAAYTPCFRREAGSYGKDVRGLNRLHQFDKVELVHFVEPEGSYEALEQLREDAERPLRRLGLPYRVLLMCTGDMGFTQAKKYDLEVWSPGQERWLEVSSISNFEAFQARRMQIRYRKEGTRKPALVHTLNGSGLALPRVIAALLEHYQTADRSVEMPEALRPYTCFDSIP